MNKDSFYLAIITIIFAVLLFLSLAILSLNYKVNMLNDALYETQLRVVGLNIQDY